MWTGRPATKLSQGPVLVTIGPGGGTAALAFCCRSICFSLSLSAFTLPLCSSISDRRLFMALISAFSALISSALTDVAASAVIAATTVPASRHRDNVLNVAGVCFLGMAPPDSHFSRNRLISSMSPPFTSAFIALGNDGGVSCQNPVIAEPPACDRIFLRPTLPDCHIGLAPPLDHNAAGRSERPWAILRLLDDAACETSERSLSSVCFKVSRQRPCAR